MKFNRQGFSLVEVAVAYGILSVVILGSLQLVDAQWKLFQAGEMSSSLRMQIVTAFSRMERELKATTAAQVDLGSGAAAATLTFRVPQDVDGDGTVLDAAGVLEWSNQITYARNATNQITRTTGGATVILANNVTALQFTRPAGQLDVMQVTVTSNKSTSLGRSITDTDQISIQMRN